MNVTISRILPDDTLSRFRIKDMRPDEVIRVLCENPAEFNNAKRQASEGAKGANRIDGFEYRIETNSTEATVTISLYKPEDN